MQGATVVRVDFFRNGEDHKYHQRERNTVNGGDLLRKQVRDGDEAQDQGRYSQPNGDLHAAQPDIEGELVFLIVALIAQHQNAQRFQEETPHHAERVGFTQQIDVAAAHDDGGNL